VKVVLKYMDCAMQIECPAANGKSIAVSPNDNINLNSVYDEQITSITHFSTDMSCTHSRKR